jgi:hypothetical protein
MAKAEVIDRDLGWRKIVKALGESAEDPNSVAYVGFFEDGTPRIDGQITNAELAVIHEYGTDKIPERSFMRSTFDRLRPNYEAMVAKLAGRVVDGKMPLAKLLDLVGLKIENDIRRAVKTGPGIEPPNAPSTIRRKGSSRPLIDTAQMINALTHDVGPERGSE